MGGSGDPNEDGENFAQEGKVATLRPARKKFAAFGGYLETAHRFKKVIGRDGASVDDNRFAYTSPPVRRGS